jgi:hypothetical protein
MIWNPIKSLLCTISGRESAIHQFSQMKRLKKATDRWWCGLKYIQQIASMIYSHSADPFLLSSLLQLRFNFSLLLQQATQKLLHGIETSFTVPLFAIIVFSLERYLTYRPPLTHQCALNTPSNSPSNPARSIIDVTSSRFSNLTYRRPVDLSTPRHGSGPPENPIMTTAICVTPMVLVCYFQPASKPCTASSSSLLHLCPASLLSSLCS